MHTLSGFIKDHWFYVAMKEQIAFIDFHFAESAIQIDDTSSFSPRFFQSSLTKKNCTQASDILSF